MRIIYRRTFKQCKRFATKGESNVKENNSLNRNLASNSSRAHACYLSFPRLIPKPRLHAILHTVFVCESILHLLLSKFVDNKFYRFALRFESEAWGENY